MEGAGHELILTSETSLGPTPIAFGARAKTEKERKQPEMIKYSFLIR